MDKVSEELILKIALSSSVDREVLLIKKYEEYTPSIKSDELKEILGELIETSKEHTDILKDKMLKLNLNFQG
ncbi:MAG: hypothetical protein N3B21_06745 [Clostridia bacterium]|nr:hypothetical protein [Clostridia bacterium]